ncbi:MAG: hypothetical protein QOJ91_1201 [Sphingomonadales bacterium]|nr:hypothetical protein [Sphingomonadales bacterium]
MSRGGQKVSRRALLGAVCVSPALSVFPAKAGTSGRPAPSPSPGGPGFRRDDEWAEALARFNEVQAVVDNAVSEPDEDIYDRLLDRHAEALTALLALPAPDLPALAAKLDAITAHQAWENTGSEDCLEILRRDAHRLAASAG